MVLFFKNSNYYYLLLILIINNIILFSKNFFRLFSYLTMTILLDIKKYIYPLFARIEYFFIFLLDILFLSLL